MGLDSKLAQIIAITVMVGALFCFSWLTVWGQSSVVDQPIVSDEAVAKTDTLRIVAKDEIQRLLNNMTLRIQKLENKVVNLEVQTENRKNEIFDLKEEIEGG